MGGIKSALEVLGLEPGADRRAIDEAFRRLMKQHHPDRPGGDSARAAEVIHAYRALRPGALVPVAVEMRVSPAAARRRRWWLIALLLAGLGIGAIWFLAAAKFDGPVDAPARLGAEVARELGLRREREPSLIERPIDRQVIERAADEARTMYRESDELALADYSRECRASFRESRSVAQFDRCVAFDVAVTLLQDRDPLRDQGPFRETAVIRRHWSDAALLSSDSLAIDSRLDRIRLRVELRLAPRFGEPEREPEPPSVNIEDAVPA
jgi:hypothetical protein